jgi:hypothetical protein
MPLNTAARIVAATLALVAAIYTINHYLLSAKTEVYKEALADVEERLDLLEEAVFVKEPKNGEPKGKGAAK